MRIITYEDKMNYLKARLEPLKDLLKCWSNIDEKNPIKKETEAIKKAIKKDIDIIECIMEDVEQMHQLDEQCQKKQDKEIADIYEELFLK